MITIHSFFKGFPRDQVLRSVTQLVILHIFASYNEVYKLQMRFALHYSFKILHLSNTVVRMTLS